jgi:hypothetical protein
MKPWYLDRRYWLGCAAVLFAIWGVECLRKGGFIWPWPLVPLALWAVVLLIAERTAPSHQGEGAPPPSRSPG